LIKDEPGFILKACIDYEVQLFIEGFGVPPNIDVKMELKPTIICEQNDSKDDHMIKKNLVLNNRIMSDFIIKLDIPNEIKSKGSVKKLFYVHSIVLTFKSDYFQALFNSNMLKTQIKCLKLIDISYFVLEKLLLFIYTNNLENVDKLENWIGLLYATSRFLIPQLIQICKLSISKFVNFENVEKVEKIAYECRALQLARYCEMFKIKQDDVKSERINVTKKFKSMLTKFIR